jgi:hypothetical protein
LDNALLSRTAYFKEFKTRMQQLKYVLQDQQLEKLKIRMEQFSNL